MKTFLFLLITISIHSDSSFGEDYWIRQATPTLAALEKCAFTDTLNGWAAGDSGVIIHTSNGGVTWVRQNSTINYRVNSIFFVNPRLGWAIANDYLLQFSTILRTTNGGLNWTSSIFPDSTVILLAIYFLDSLEGWMAGFGCVFLHTTNGGQNWIYVPRDTTNFSCFPVRNFSFYSRFYGFATGGVNDYGGVTWRTINRGAYWSTHPVAPEPIFDLYFVDSLHVIGCGGDFEYGPSFVKTTDAGANWEYVFLGLWGVGTAVAYRNPAEIWLALSFSQKWAVTFDSTDSWQELQAPDSSAVYDALFVDETHGWCCGTNGLVAKYLPRPIGIQNEQNNVPVNSVLFQNYPNPFNPSTNIEYYLPRAADVTLTVYDLLGREIQTVFRGFQKRGYHSVEFSPESLPSGMYIYRLKTEGFTDAKKMVFLK